MLEIVEGRPQIREASYGHRWDGGDRVSKNQVTVAPGFNANLAPAGRILVHWQRCMVLHENALQPPRTIYTPSTWSGVHNLPPTVASEAAVLKFGGAQMCTCNIENVDQLYGRCC